MTERVLRVSGRGFLPLYALAWAGAAIAYTPFLTILLPVRIEMIAGPASVHWLAVTTFIGAIAASIANILFGWASDRSGTRRPWVLAGLLLSGGLLMLVPHATTLPVLTALIIGWQVALNMMLGPLAAWAGDVVPDRHKGLLGGLLAFAPACGALTGALVTIPGLADPSARLTWVAAITAACIAPIILFGAGRAPGHETQSPAQAAAPIPMLRAMATRMWFARLLIQISEAALFAYLYVWLRGIDAGFGDAGVEVANGIKGALEILGDAGVARLLAIVLLLAAPAALAAGYAADARRRPTLPLQISAVVGAVGLALMALATTGGAAAAGFLVFGVSTNIFLALHSAQTLRVLPDARYRGRDLGLFNLTNTVPSLIMPSLTLGLVPLLGFPALFAVMALLALGAAWLLRGVSIGASDRQA